MVATGSIAMMVFCLLFGIAIIVIPPIIMKKKYKASLKVFFIGCAVWFIFTQILEALLHSLILNVLPVGKIISNNIFLYAVYGGLAAGIFEEVGRLLAMKFVLKDKYVNPHNSIMYGFGHGGFEAFYILSIGMISNLLFSVMINTGMMDKLYETVSDSVAVNLRVTVQQLINISPATFLASPIERISAVILHIALSILVWTAVVKKKNALFLLAIALHTFVDMGTVLINHYSGGNLILVEGIVLFLAAAIAYYAAVVFEKYLVEEKSAESEQLQGEEEAAPVEATEPVNDAEEKEAETNEAENNDL